MQKSVKIRIGSKPLSVKLQEELSSVLNSSTKSYVWPNQVAVIESDSERKEHCTMSWRTLFYKRTPIDYKLLAPAENVWELQPERTTAPTITLAIEREDNAYVLRVTFSAQNRLGFGRMIDSILVRSLFKRLQSNLKVWQQIERLRPLPEKIELSQGFYFFCTCRRSKNWPFCDGSHKGSAFEPTARRVDKRGETIRFCRCMASESWPICDNQHLLLGQDHLG